MAEGCVAMNFRRRPSNLSERVDFPAIFSTKMLFARGNRCFIAHSRYLMRGNSTVPFSRKNKRIADDSLKYNFDAESKAMLLEIENAITPMKELNKDFQFVKLAGEFQVNTGENGWFMFKINRSEKSIYMASPISGPFEYKYCPENKLWLNSLDKHDMRGMIVRDMLRKFIGFPKF